VEGGTCTSEEPLDVGGNQDCVTLS